MQNPSIGRIVHYRLTEKDAEAINRRRTTGKDIAERIPRGCWTIGAQAHIGNTACAGEVVPLTITKVWPEEYAQHLSDDGSSTVQAKLAHHQSPAGYESSFGVNGQATLDGNDSLWVCSAPQHATLDGCWFWPPRE